MLNPNASLRFPGNDALSGPWSDSGRVLITPALAAAIRGANFATAKFRDAYGSQLEAIVKFVFIHTNF